jgi:DNA repair exonuclease SbcCD ATPase subunit
MRITKIHLQNIGVFEDTTIDSPGKTDPGKAEIHILTGENGTGKSTILLAFAS